ncbi:MAG: ABC transporter permease [Caldisericia bacterium]|nr:ABC transporter permease [Caldisericia bacterium]
MNLFRFALKNLRRNVTRSVLTILSIAIAVTLLISFLGLNEGYTRAILKDVNQLGAQLLAVPKGCPYEATALIISGGVLPAYLPEEAMQKMLEIPNVNQVYGILMGLQPSQTEPGTSDIIYGVTDGIFALKKSWNLTSEVFKEAGAIIGFKKAEMLKLAKGDSITIGTKKTTYKILEILPLQGTEDDSIIYIPLQEAQALFSLPSKVTGIAVTLKDPTKMAESVTEIEKLQDVQVVTMDQVIGIVLKFINTVKVLLLGIILIAILISGLQILNSLLMSILEQIKEFGVFKAIGSTNQQIRWIVLFQTFIIVVTGCLFAIGIVFVLRPFLNNLVKLYVSSAPKGNLIVFEPWMFLAGTAFALLVGFLASLYPAWKASSQVPAKVIHMEVQV